MKPEASRASRLTSTSPTEQNKTRTRIIAAARICYAQKDIVQTSMADIAQQAALARATLYRHFPSHEAIVMAVFREEVATFLQRFLNQIGEAESFCDYLLDYMAFSVKQASSAPMLKTLFSEQSAIWVSRTYFSDPDTLALTASIFRESFLVARRVGEIAADLELAEIMDVCVRMLMSFILMPSTNLNDEAQVRSYFSKYIIRALRP